MQLDDIGIQKVITRLLNGQDYRVEILALIDSEFLQYAVEFFKKVAAAKLDNQRVTDDWYKATFLNPNLPTDDLIINSGLNRKSISNMYKGAGKSLVIDVTAKHYDELYQSISTLAEQEEELNLILTVKLRGVSVDLNLTESLIVMNTLAVKRAQIRGGAWSTAGKRVEKHLMLTLCDLFQVPPSHYVLTGLTDAKREVDFFLQK